MHEVYNQHDKQIEAKASKFLRECILKDHGQYSSKFSDDKVNVQQLAPMSALSVSFQQQHCECHNQDHRYVNVKL
jgi:hypothetical protein